MYFWYILENEFRIRGNMNDTKAIQATDEDLMWARKLKRVVGRQLLRSTADALVADALAGAIKKKQLWRVDFLLETPLSSAFSRSPAPVSADSAFEAAWNGMWSKTREKARYKFPALNDNQRTCPLTAAAIAGFTDGAELLLKKGAAPFEKRASSPTGYTGPLSAAIFYGKEDMISLLMAQPAVKAELAAEPKFRNWILLTALGTDCAATLAHVAKCDPELMEKGRVYGDHKAEEFKLGEGIFAAKEKLKAQRAFEAAQNPPKSKYGHGPKYRPRPGTPENS
jgi:hypothetical protein